MIFHHLQISGKNEVKDVNVKLYENGIIIENTECDFKRQKRDNVACSEKRTILRRRSTACEFIHKRCFRASSSSQIAPIIMSE
jgi:hypothetical protein